MGKFQVKFLEGYPPLRKYEVDTLKSAVSHAKNTAMEQKRITIVAETVGHKSGSYHPSISFPRKYGGASRVSKIIRVVCICGNLLIVDAKDRRKIKGSSCPNCGMVF